MLKATSLTWSVNKKQVLATYHFIQHTGQILAIILLVQNLQDPSDFLCTVADLNDFLWF